MAFDFDFEVIPKGFTYIPELFLIVFVFFEFTCVKFGVNGIFIFSLKLIILILFSKVGDFIGLYIVILSFEKFEFLSFLTFLSKEVLFS